MIPRFRLTRPTPGADAIIARTLGGVEKLFRDPRQGVSPDNNNSEPLGAA